jgi:G3E family GTPase
VDEATLGVVEARIRAMNPFATIRRTQRCAVDPADVLGRGAFDLARILEMEPTFLEEDAHEHDAAVTSVSLVSEAPLDADRFQTWIRRLTATQGADILRFKGILAFRGSDRREVIQGVHMLIDADALTPWKPGEPRTSRFVLIGRNLDRAALEAGFAACAA